MALPQRESCLDEQCKQQSHTIPMHKPHQNELTSSEGSVTGRHTHIPNPPNTRRWGSDKQESSSGKSPSSLSVSPLHDMSPFQTKGQSTSEGALHSLCLVTRCVCGYAWYSNRLVGRQGACIKVVIRRHGSILSNGAGMHLILHWSLIDVAYSGPCYR